MKIQVLNDLQEEISRLFIAGSRFAKNDPRISKYIPALYKMGEKAPVMKKLAEKVETLVNADQNDSMEALSDAGTFLYAVLATQGSSALEYEEIPYEGKINQIPKTNTPYSRLRPVIDALTLSKSGRLTVIQSAYKDGLLTDFRLYGYLVGALNDKYAEIAEFLQNEVIPGIGSVIVPYLLEGYDVNGGKSDARRLALLGTLGYEHAEQLANEAIEQGDIVLQVEGIKILAKNPSNEKFLLTLAKDKKAAIREAALASLIRLDSLEGKELMLETLLGSRFKNAVEGAKECSDPVYVEKILAAVKTKYQDFLEKSMDQKSFNKNLDDLEAIFGALEKKDSDSVCEFYKEILGDTKYYKFAKQFGNYRVGGIPQLASYHISLMPHSKALRLYESVCNKETAKAYPELIKDYYNVASRYYDAKKVYDVFSSYYILKLLTSRNLYHDLCVYHDAWEEGTYEDYLHPDWQKLFYAKDDLLAIGLKLNEENAESQEGQKIKNTLLSIIKKRKKKNPNWDERAVMKKILRFTEEAEREKITKGIM